LIAAVFHYAFLQRALAAGLFIALACAVLGVFLLLRKDAMLGHGLSHVAFAGVAIGLLVGWMPLLSALVVSVAAALGIMRLKETAGLHGDTAIAIFSSVGLALGVTLASISGRFNVALFGFLFGDVLAIEPAEVALSIALAIAVVGLVAFHYHRFLFMTFDREAARVAGVPVRRLDALITVLAAVTIVLGMKIVGILLVAALLVIPAAAGLQAARSFRGAVLGASIVSALSVIVGLLAAYALDWPASGTIVLTAFLLFAVLYLRRPREGR
jgi:zinc transport system permease protein